MKKGCYTALITPFGEETVDFEGLDQLISFQLKNSITGILAVGTTGESPTLSWQEHNKVIETIRKATSGKALCIAGTGSNNSKEALVATEHAAKSGVDAVLLVDPYYNGPSSLEIRREYIAPIAKKFKDLTIIPYVIPGRTGAQLLPQDIALLFESFKNVSTVKEATGDIENMRLTRKFCGEEFSILSGDDALTLQMMTDDQIKAKGTISVISNIVPGAATQLSEYLSEGKIDEAKKLNTALSPLFELVTIKTEEKTPFGPVTCRARNPLAIKTAMSVLGMPSGSLRAPMGKMTRAGLEKVIAILKTVNTDHPFLFEPIEDFFNVSIEERLEDSSLHSGLCYTDY